MLFTLFYKYSFAAICPARFVCASLCKGSGILALTALVILLGRQSKTQWTHIKEMVCAVLTAGKAADSS